jgi:uncharacterized membrane protein
MKEYQVMGQEKKKFKLPSWATYLLLGLELALMIALVTISIIALKNAQAGSGGPFIKWLIGNRVWFFVLIVLPLIILFLFNVYLLIKVMNEASSKEFKQMSKEELLEEARRQAREELQKELAKQEAAEPDEK